MASDIPFGYCQCGCGQITPIARRSNNRLGHIKGSPVRFCIGHKLSMIERHDRFWSRVDICDEAKCWEWKGYINDSGYGCLRTKGNALLRAHRVAYELTFGVITDGLFICHRCDNPKCCNPKHLFAGTPRDNVDDMHKKGRESHDTGLKGEQNNGAKLTQSQVDEIRSRYAAGGITYQSLATEHGVTLKTIYRIIKRKLWA